MVYYIPLFKIPESGNPSVGYTIINTTPLNTAGNVQELIEQLQSSKQAEGATIIPLNFIPLNG